MNIIVLDLEWNGSYSRRKKGYVNEIIEFGAVKCDENLVVQDTFSCFIKPQIAKKLSSIISDLTSITDEALIEGIPFMKAVSRFRKWAKNSVILTWGPSDVLALTENCHYFNGTRTVPFLKKYVDLQFFAEKRLGLSTSQQVGLGKAAELVGIHAENLEMHRALDDSLLALEILRKVYDSAELERFTTICDEEFYNRVTFKTSYICDLTNPAIDRKQLKFVCPKCGSASHKTSEWILKNKSFRAEFLCPTCGYVFAGRLIVKQKYEGISVNKKSFPIPIIEPPREALSAVVGNMNLSIAENGVGLLTFQNFFEGNAKHAFSTRIGGVSQNEFAAINLGFGRGDSDKNVKHNYNLFAEALGVPPESFVAGAQDHHTNIRRVTKENIGTGIWKPKDLESIDGLCTNELGVTLVIYCADCVPLYCYDEEHHAIGLAHAGWKGTAADMAGAMVQKMAAEFGSNPATLKVAIGPSISKDRFEVDLPVAQVFEELPNSAFFVTDTGDGKSHVDLWECNRQFLLSAGVKPENIKVGNVCTMKESDLVFSHRKTRGQRGSNAAVMALI
ncbi:peptidoglycan editing factor PgeF [Scatolibacter rhodanostii]|uniref:peptidoglycan editing factor PgeF n=1 Tax=Scatolibacter rhodanostii TaxID=2014781 RepID=UPI000C06AF1A|nr:peptidoglycan editing factor PgeF [Scatolibacter rhodanostii]